VVTHRIRRIWVALGAIAAIAILVPVTFELWRPHVAAYLVGRTVLSAEHYRFELPPIDRVEVLVLGEFLVGPALGRPTFTAPATGQHYSVLRQIEVSGARMETVLRAWRVLRISYEQQGMCHTPGYALRFLQGPRVVLETGICFKCRNFSIPVPPFGGQLYGFDARGPSGSHLLSLLEALSKGAGAGA